MSTRLIFNSVQRTSGRPAKCNYKLPQPGIRGTGFSIDRIEVPHVFLNVNSLNNTIQWTDDVSNVITSTLTSGNYTIDELMSHMASVMTTATLGNGGTASYLVTLDNGTISNKINITNNLGANFSIEWSTNSVTQQLAYDLGFSPVNADTDIGRPSIVDSTGASSYTANNQFWIGQPKTINIKSSLAQYCLIPPAISVLRNGGRFNIIDQMLVPTVPSEITTYYPNFEKVFPMSLDTVISEVSFELLDDEFQTLDLQGREWTIVLNIYGYNT
jgi:hypothetical protein